MTTPDPSNEPVPATLSTLSRALLIISIGLASFLFGSGFENLMDEGINWLQIAKVVVPTLLILCVGYVFVESSES